jgi:DNA-binding NtrC family response regulator
MPMPMPQRVLVVDDEASIRESLADALTEEGLAVHLVADGRAALAAIADEVPDVVLADVRMPELGGLALLRAIRSRDQAIDVILMTAFDDMPTVAAAMREGAADFLTKPLDLHELRRVLRRVFDDRRTRLQGVHLPAMPAGTVLEQLVGRDAKMIDIYKMVGQVAASRTNVLIRGESGTGKELIARAIHEQSAAASEPFVAVNCSALPPSLLESELFGHTRGAFTGAVGARRGRFALAGRGTIFLDEIGDTSADFQTKLLRVLQQQEFYPVGAERPERTEARVIAATHRNLEEMISKGLFREDLYYRLRVVEITVPPLRERPSDLPVLVDHLVKRAGTALGRREPVVAPEAFEAIRHHRWPGNVRELENCLRRAVVLATGDVIRPEHLGIGAVASDSPAHLPSLAELEREHVARVMAATHGHKARAAQILGVSRPRLNRLLQQYGLE